MNFMYVKGNDLEHIFNVGMITDLNYHINDEGVGILYVYTLGSSGSSTIVKGISLEGFMYLMEQSGACISS